MKTLAELKCAPCKGNVPALTDMDISMLLPELPNWELFEFDGIKRLERIFEFKDFANALDFANRVGAIAEAEDHHPLITIEWGRVTVQWWTHTIRRLHKNDFIMAAKTDSL